jgi:diguanylate cyclase (GGDEF)-like protein/PAS domain S-box-containing protein
MENRSRKRNGPGHAPAASIPAEFNAEARLRLVIDAAPNAMLMVNGKGEIVLVNAQAEQLFGYSRQELLGQQIEMLVPERFHGVHGDYRKGFFAQPNTRAMGAGRDLFGLRKNRTEVPIEIGLNPLHTDEGLFVLASIIDITERKRLEVPFRLTVEAAPYAMIMSDSSGRITMANAQAERLFGYEPGTLLGCETDILVPPSIRQRRPAMRTGYFSSPHMRPFGIGRELSGWTRDGREIPIEVGLNPIETPEGRFDVASIIDITERKRMTDLMVSAEARLRLVIDAAPNAMLMVNGDGSMTLVNAQAEKLFGYSRQELLGQPIEMLVPKRYHGGHAGYRKGFFAKPDTRSMGVGRDLYGLRKDGSEVPIEIGLNPLRTDEGLFVLASIIDITERKRAEEIQRLSQANLLRQSILDSAPFSIIAIDTHGIIIAANPASELMLGYGKGEMVGQYAPSLINLPDDIERHANDLSRELDEPIIADHHALIACAERDLPDEREWTYVRKDGTRMPVNLSITALHDEHGTINGFLNVAYDITERKRTEATILHMAHHDALTGLPNRSLLMDRIDMAIRHARRADGRVAVLMMDLDHFKRVNDTLGHQAGDQLLLTVARRIREGLRETDTVARLGGDEFVVLLADAGTREEVRRTVEQIVQRVTQPMAIDGHEILITPSVGGCLFPDDGDDASTLLKNADTAMYAAKAAGRSNSQWFNHEMSRQTEEKLALAGALRRAIDDGQFSIHYQPEVDLASGRAVGVEALIRWQHPKLGAVSPNDFIPLAEETGLILPIGEWVLKTACVENVRIGKACGQPLVLAVNVSPRQFQQKNWISVVRAALDESGLPPAQLELEITEGMLMQDPKESAEMLRAIRKLGVGVVVDDFGTGYSSLSYLTRFPIDKIKIDRSFVRDLTLDATDAAVIDAIIAMAHSLKICVIAEGVETPEQLAYLRERGCDQAQGYYFGKAVSVIELPALLGSLAQHAAGI